MSLAQQEKRRTMPLGEEPVVEISERALRYAAAGRRRGGADAKGA